MTEKSRNAIIDNDIRDNNLLITDFKVEITNYKKVSSFLETFIVYTIGTSGDFRPYVVERRYNDFQWLFQRIIERYPMAIIPPLPTKHSITTIERFSGTFIEQRKNSLDKFLQRLVKHHILGLDKEFHAFLTLLPTMFLEYKRGRPVVRKVETMWQSLQYLTPLASDASHSLSIVDPSFNRLIEDSTKYATAMGSLGRVVKRTGDIWENISNTVRDSGISNRPEAMNKVLDTNWEALIAMGDQCAKTSVKAHWELEPWVIEGSLYWSQVEQVARRRKEAELKFLTSVVKQSNDQSNADVTKKMTNLLHDTVSKHNADLKSELDRWLPERTEESRNWLALFADVHIDHYKRTSSIWRQIVSNECD